jgi:8-oxo-dGTP pyrophosphatase MutT (NUDIX family)
LVDTVLREAEEEIGLGRDAIEILEQLPTLETRTSGFAITPFLARIVPARPWRPHEAEIAEVLEVVVADLARPEAFGESIEEFPTWGGPQSVPFYQVGPHRLWGATYRILNPLMPRLVAGKWGERVQPPPGNH